MATAYATSQQTDSDAPGRGMYSSASTDGRGNRDGRRMPGASFDFWEYLYRYRIAGNTVLSAGIIGGILAYCWGLAPAWVGFMAGSLPVSIVVATIQAKNDARRSTGVATRAG